MTIAFPPLSPEKKKDLELRHRHERDRRVADRIKAVLLKNEGWTTEDIAQALRVHPGTAMQHLTDWATAEKLQPQNGGSSSKLSAEQARSIEAHLENHTYQRVYEICAYVARIYNVFYTVSGMTKWLHQHNFSYKQPKAVPAKANLVAQEEFIEQYIELIANVPANEPILFMDSAHPTMATKIVCGWIRKGQDKAIAQIASRTRVNIMGAIELLTMKTLSTHPESVNGASTVDFLKKSKLAYLKAPKLHIILDQSGYHRSKIVKDFAESAGIVLHYLPPYSPNLNPIERLWKVMNEKVRNNRVFQSAKDFRDSIRGFFEITMPEIAQSLRERINDDFQTIKPAS